MTLATDTDAVGGHAEEVCMTASNAHSPVAAAERNRKQTLAGRL